MGLRAELISGASLAHHLTNQFGDLQQLTDIYTDGQATVSVLRRQRIDLAAGEINGVDPDAELIVAAGDQTWTLARRTLPPMPEFGADPHQVPSREERAVELPDEMVRDLASTAATGADLAAAMTNAPGLPASVRDFLKADASVTCLSVVQPGGDAPPGIAVMFWARGANGFYRIASGDRPGLFVTQPAISDSASPG